VMISEKMSNQSLIATIHIENRGDVWDSLDYIVVRCKDCICGPPFIMYKLGINAKQIELGYPVTRQINNGKLETHMFEFGQTFFTFYFGPHSLLDGATKSFLTNLREDLDFSHITIKEIYHEIYPESPEDNVTEIQAFIHSE